MGRTSRRGPWTCRGRSETVRGPILLLQYALGQLWLSWGVVPSAVAGSGIGQCAAICLTGALTVSDALQLATGESWLTAAIPADNPHCSCKLTRVCDRQDTQSSRGFRSRPPRSARWWTRAVARRSSSGAPRRTFSAWTSAWRRAATPRPSPPTSRATRWPTCSSRSPATVWPPTI